MSNPTHAGHSQLLDTSGDRWLRLARFIADIGSPPSLAVSAFFLMCLYDRERLGPDFRLGWTYGLALLFGSTLPVLMVLSLRLFGKIDSLHIPQREQRTVPFLLMILSYTLGTLVLWSFTGPGMTTALMFSFALNTFVVMIINFWWKISGHGTGVGAPLAALTVVAGWWVLPLFSLFGIIGWCRLYLKAHTPAQVVAGSLFGYFFTLLQLLIIFEAAWK